MSHANGVDSKNSGFEALVGAHLAEVSVVEQSVLVEFVFDVGEGEFGAPDWNFELRKKPWQRADMVFVAVSENDASNALAIFDEIGDVGDDDVDAEEFGLGEHESGIDDDDVIAPAHGHTVHAEFAQATERDNLKFSGGHGVRMMLAQ